MKKYYELQVEIIVCCNWVFNLCQNKIKREINMCFYHVAYTKHRYVLCEKHWFPIPRFEHITLRAKNNMGKKIYIYPHGMSKSSWHVRIIRGHNNRCERRRWYVELCWPWFELGLRTLEIHLFLFHFFLFSFWDRRPTKPTPNALRNKENAPTMRGGGAPRMRNTAM